jgi:tape measure domain-containing protein
VALTISFSADASNVTQVTNQVSANLSAAFKGVTDQMKAMESASGQASAKMVTGLQQLSQQTLKLLAPQTDLSRAFLQTGQAAQGQLASFQRLAAQYGTSAQLTAKMAAGLTQLSQSTIKLVAPQGDLGRAMLQTGKAAETQVSSFDKLRRQYQETAQTSERVIASQRAVSTSFTSVGATLKSLAAGFGLILGAQGFAALVKGIVDAGVEMERFTRTLIAALGTSALAEKAFAFITAESNRLGQSVMSMVPVFTQLAAATRNTVLEGERTRELFSALSGAGVAVGLSTEATGRAMVGLIQIISQNAIQLDEFRNQFASQIPGAMAATAKAMGLTTESLLRGIQKQKIGVNDLIIGVTQGLQILQKTAPDMANAVETAFQQLSNAIFQLSADIARSGLLDLLAKIARFASREVLGIGRFFNLSTVTGVEQLSKLQDKLQAIDKVRAQVAERAADPTIFQKLTGLIGTSAQEQMNALDQEAAGVRAQMEQLRGEVDKQQVADEARARERQKLLEDEAAGRKKFAADEAAARQGAQDAAARARANVGLTQERVNQEKIALEQIQALREQALERDYATAVANTQQTKTAQEDIERAFAIRRLDITRQSALEDAALQERTAITIRDSRIAAIKAADAAAQAAAAGPEATAESQINANKRSAASAIELQTVTLAAETAKQEAAAKRTAAEADYEKGVSAVVKGERASQIKITEEQLKRESELRQQALQSQSGILDAEKELIQAQVEGLVLTREEGIARTQALEVQALENRRAQLEGAFTEELRVLQKRVDANEAAQAEITALETKHQGDLQALNIQQQTLEQTHRNELLKGWRDWVHDVQSTLSGVLVDVFEGEVDSIKDVFDSLKSYFFKILADMIAYAATNAIIVPIISTVLGGFGGGASGGLLSAVGLGASLIGGGAGGEGGTGGGAGGAGGGLMGTGSTLLTGAGLARTLYSYLGIDSLLGSVKTGFSALQETFLTGIDSLFGSSLSAAQQAADMAALIAGEEAIGGLGTGSAAGVSGAGGSALGIAAGLAALGFGIYSALNASNIASKAAFAASAAAGAAAAASAAYGVVTGGSLVVAGTTGWTGIGAIVAAVMAVIGTILDRVIKPSGPTLSVGRPGGLDIGVEGDKLAVSGDLKTRVLRREGLDPGLAKTVQDQMAEGITAAVMSMVQTINAVALDPKKLLEPTQAALRDALASVKDLNSSNIEKMSTDISEQLRFINIQIVAGMLDPVNKAFDQLRDDSNLKQQIERLPGTTSGLVAVFKNLNDQLAEIGKGESSDVLRQLSAVRNQVENFGNRIAGTAGQISEAIVNGIVKSFEDAKVDISLAKQITQFAELMNQSLGALSSLRATQQTLEGAGLPGGGVGAQIDRLTKAMGEQAARLSTELVSTALGDLGTQVEKIITQPLQVQATTVNALFTDSMAALNTLWAQWHALADAGIDTTLMQEQFNRLVTGVLETTRTVLDQAFAQGSFSEFLAVLAGIPKAVTDLNPEFAKFRMIAEAFAPVVNIAAQGILVFEDAMRSTAEKVAFSAGRINDLRGAIANAGDSADKALPLYAQLAQAIISTANLQIQQIQEIAQAWHSAMDQTRSDIERLEDILGTYRAPATAPAQPSPGIGYRTPEEPGQVDYSALGHPGVGYRIPTPGPPAIQPPMPPPAAVDESAKAMTRLVAAIIDLRVKATDFQTAVMSGDVEGAIKAIHAYEQAIVKWADTAIKEIEKERQAYIDAQQAVIDGIQRQIEAQEGVIDAINDQIDAQQDVIDAIHDQMDAQQDVIDGVQDQIDAQQDLMDATREAISAQQEVVDLLRDETDARQETVDTIKREIEALKQLRDRIGDITREEAVPAAAAGAIRAQMAATREHLGTVSGDEAIKDLEKLVSLNQELLNLGEESSQLILIQEALNNLAMLQQELNERLAGKEGELSVAEQQLETAKAALAVGEDQLKALEVVLAGQESVMKGLQDQLAFQQDILKGLNDQLEAQEDVMKGLQDQLEFQQDILKELQDRLAFEQKVLAEIEKSTYWDTKIAEIQAIALAELYNIEKWLAGVQGPTTWEDQIKKIQEDAVAQLKQIELDLKALFLKTVDSTGAAVMGAEYQRQTAFWSERMSQYNLALPVKVTVGNFNEAPRQHGGPVTAFRFAQGGGVSSASGSAFPHVWLQMLEVSERQLSVGLMILQATQESTWWTKQSTSIQARSLAQLQDIRVVMGRQHGGIVGLASGLHYAQGGMVPTLLEPGERVLTGLNPAQRGAALAWNAAFPRFAAGGFTVPGSGTGDSVPMMLPGESVILNTRASKAMGYQGGGSVNGNGGKTEVHNYHYSFPNLTIRSHQDLEELKRALRELERQGLRRRPQQ